MRIAMVSVLSLSLGLAGCGTPAPVELPENDIEAASTCFAAQGLVGREGKGEDDPVSYEEFAAAIAYPMAAAAQADPFDPQMVAQVIEGSEAAAQRIASMDYAGAVTTCNARFGIDDSVALPASDTDAIFACLGFGGFMQGAIQTVGGDLSSKTAEVEALVERLAAQADNDPQVVAAIAGQDVTQIVNAGLQSAFAEGAPDAYLAACNARFPAKN